MLRRLHRGEPLVPGIIETSLQARLEQVTEASMKARVSLSVLIRVL